MLALPVASAGLGLIGSLVVITLMWALMAYTALLMLEIHQYAPASATLNTLSKEILGPRGQMVSVVAMLFLFYSLCAAYISGGGEQFNAKLVQVGWIGQGSIAGTVLFTLVIAGVVSWGTGKVDTLNRGLFALKIVAMFTALFVLAPEVSRVHLTEMPLEQGLFWAALPVVFTSFGFHGSIPSIVRYLDNNTKALRTAVLLGSALPLVIYLIWQSISLGVLGQHVLLSNPGLAPMISALSATTAFAQLGNAISIFADLALATSFLGVSLGLFDFLGDTLRRKANATGRIQTALVTFIPPFLFAVLYPNGFITALGFAAVALVILAVVLPVAMTYRIRKTRTEYAIYKVKGGSPALLLCLLAGLTVATAQFLLV